MLLAEAADSRQRLGGGNDALAENPGLVAGKVEDGRSNAGKLARVDQRTARGANLLRNVREPARVGAVVDAGELPGLPSTVLDFTGPEPRVLREGAAPGAEALDRVTALLA